MVWLSSWADSFSKGRLYLGNALQGRFANHRSEYVAGKEAAVVAENRQVEGRNPSVGREDDADIKLTFSLKDAINCSGIHPDHIAVAKLETVSLLERLQPISTESRTLPCKPI